MYSFELTSQSSDSDAEALNYFQAKPKQCQILLVPGIFKIHLRLISCQWESKRFPLMKSAFWAPPNSNWAIKCLMQSVLLLSSAISKCSFIISHVQALQFFYLSLGMSIQKAGLHTEQPNGSRMLNGCHCASPSLLDRPPRFSAVDGPCREHCKLFVLGKLGNITAQSSNRMVRKYQGIPWKLTSEY